MAAGAGAVVEFGTRRAHTPEAGTLGARAAYIGGCAGTSNTLAGFRYGIPVMGTAAHSWVMSFPCEMDAFRSLQRVLGDATVQLIDTYDTLEGARRAAKLGRPLWGVRLDSGDFDDALPAGARDSGRSRPARRQDHGRAAIWTNTAFANWCTAGAPIDSFGVGTQLATRADAPHMGAIYKMVELEICGIKRFTAKYSEDKSSLPGAKQIFRDVARDVVARSGECGKGEALLRPMILGGRLIEPLPALAQSRARAAESHREAAARSATIGGCGAVAGDPEPGIARVGRPDTLQSARMKTIFFDIDTQLDFLYPAGALYVPGAERIVPAIARLNRHAAAHGIPVISTTDAHPEDDPEFRIWPPHCVAGTTGQRKAEATLLEKRVVVPNREHDLAVHGAQQIIVEKQHVDVFTAPNFAARGGAPGGGPFCDLRRGDGNLRAFRGPQPAEIWKTDDHRDRRDRSPDRRRQRSCAGRGACRRRHARAHVGRHQIMKSCARS